MIDKYIPNKNRKSRLQDKTHLSLAKASAEQDARMSTFNIDEQSEIAPLLIQESRRRATRVEE